MDALLDRAAPAAILAALIGVFGSGASAQDSQTGGHPRASPTTAAPAAAAAPEQVRPATLPSPAAAAPAAEEPSTPTATASKPRTEPPPGPPIPTRAPAAILRVLDKVTAETMAFEAPIGRRVRYKSLVFEVKACETRGVGDPQPQPSAYVIVTSDAAAAAGAALAPRRVFKGWMFANAPSLNPLGHPVYDAWLVACGAPAPAR